MTHYRQLHWAGNVARVEKYKEYATNRELLEIFHLGIRIYS
jgi:hypothetical protein